MRRRLFLLAVLQLLASTLSGPAAAQPATKVYRVGMLCAASCTTSDVQTFRRELAALGYKDGVNVAFEDRPYGDDLTRIPELVSDLVRQNVDLIYSTFGTVGGLAAKRATTSIPIVVGSAGDIVGAGMVKSLGHPGGNVTGITSLALELEPKRLELLKQLLPTVSRIAFFHDTENTYSVLATKEQRIAAAQLGVDLKEIQVHKTSDIDRAFAEVIDDRVNALCVDAYMPLLVGRDRIVELAAKHRVAAMIADFDEAVAELVPTASAARYEEALANLGSYLGFEAERPEKVYKKGPDVLWRTDATFDFVIEAKSKKEEDNPLYKNDHAQLLEAEAWFKSTYPSRAAVRISALPEAVADPKASTTGSFAFRLGEITKLVVALRGVLSDLVVSPGNADALRERCEAALRKANLKPDGIKANFHVPFAMAAKAA